MRALLNKKVCLLMLGFSFVSGSSQAAGLVDKVQKTYQDTETFKAQFVQKTHIALLEKDVQENGSLQFAKPGKFVIKYQGKRERRYISDGETLWIYYPQQKEAEVYQQVQDLVSREALVFLGGLGTMTREFRVAEKKPDQLILSPKKKDSLFEKITLTIDSQTNFVSAAAIQPKSGNMSQYVFSDFVTNEVVKDDMFLLKDKSIRYLEPLPLN